MANPNFPFFLIVVVVAFQIADILTTYYGLKMGLKEANPFFQWDQAILKVFLPIWSYAVYSYLINFISGDLKAKAELCFEAIWLVVIFIYAFIVARNLWLIHEAMKNEAVTP